MRKLIQLLILFIFCISYVIADSPEFPNFIKDFGEMGETSIENLDGFYPELTGLTLLAGTLIWKYDEVIREKFVDENNKRFKNDIFNASTLPAKWYGSNNKNLLITFVGVTASSYLYGKAFNKKKAVETSYLLAESFVATAGIIEVSKFILGRSRPFNNLSSKHFKFFNKHSSHHSMPSGHTGIAYAMTNIIAMSSDSYVVKIPCYLWATSAGLQRVGFDVHWVSDTIIGGLIGYGVSTFLYNNYYDKNDNKKLEPLLNINLVIPL